MKDVGAVFEEKYLSGLSSLVSIPILLYSIYYILLAIYLPEPLNISVSCVLETSGSDPAIKNMINLNFQGDVDL